MILRSLVASVAVLAICAVGFATPGGDRPFKGEQDAEFFYTGFDGEFLEIQVIGSGKYTHMGRTTFVSSLRVSVITGAGSGTAIYTAANGDQLFTESVSQQINADQTYYEVTTVGGTGRFADASGFSVGIGTTTSRTDAGGLNEAWFEGTISY